MQPSGVIIVLVLLVLSITTTISVVLITDEDSRRLPKCLNLFFSVLASASEDQV